MTDLTTIIPVGLGVIVNIGAMGFFLGSMRTRINTFAQQMSDLTTRVDKLLSDDTNMRVDGADMKSRMTQVMGNTESVRDLRDKVVALTERCTIHQENFVKRLDATDRHIENLAAKFDNMNRRTNRDLKDGGG